MSSDNWSIPKKKPPKEQDRSRSSSMTMAIPRRMSQPPEGGGGGGGGGRPSFSGSIPRRQTSHGGSSYDEPPRRSSFDNSSRGYPPDDRRSGHSSGGSIPRRHDDHRGRSSHYDDHRRSSTDHHHHHHHSSRQPPHHSSSSYRDEPPRRGSFNHPSSSRPSHPDDRRPSHPDDRRPSYPDDRRPSHSGSIPRRHDEDRRGNYDRRPSHQHGGGGGNSRYNEPPRRSSNEHNSSRPHHGAPYDEPRRSSSIEHRSSRPSQGAAFTDEPRRSSIEHLPSGAIKIPRKKSLPAHFKPSPRDQPPPSQSSSTSHSKQPPQREQPIRIGGGFSIVSENPFKIRIPLTDVPLDEGGVHQHRTSTRTPKRNRPQYQELDDTDSDFLASDSDNEKKRAKKKKKLSKSTTLPPGTSAPATGLVAGPDAVMSPLESLPPGAALPPGVTGLEGPPEGTLNSLWYSREEFLLIFAMEKILAWKTRVVTQIEWIPETLPESGPPTNIPHISPTNAAKWSGMALTNPLIFTDPVRRMEVSRIVPEQCPIVLVMAAEAEKSKESGPKFRLKPTVDTYKEEVFLVKWRGRSHLHASWERGSDIIKYDKSNNTARNKIRRFVQSQELAFGYKWKEVLEEERATAASIHAHGEQTSQVDADFPEEEYYPPGVTEVERILACDESDMGLSQFSKQRALNSIREQDLVQRRDKGTVIRWRSEEGLKDLLQEKEWDPEDNVRYVVKWKGLPFAEMTWEYWRDIKRDAVDETEDFWIRQKPPDEATIERCIKRAHPHLKDFRKIQESPVFGISSRKREVADLGQEKETKEEEEEDAQANDGLRLRSYQLEGVNWLLFNWWNKRSCILADEMGLGKTIQSMAFIKSLQDLPSTGVRGPFLIVAPLSLIGQWQAEAKTWAPDLNIVLYHGSADARDFLVKQDFFYTDQFVPKPTATKLKKNHITKFHILITTYEVVLKDIAVISKIRWRALIVDEAHRLKNPKSRLFADLTTVPRDYCVLLTGTPLANATEELWALLHFADSAAFADKDEFLDKFGQLTDVEQVEQLHSVLKPYLLRRVKEDVEKSLPPKEETILEVSLTPVQKQYYKAIYERNTTFLFKGSKPNNSPSLMNVMMELRKCCNHPFLVRGAEERILNDALGQLRGTKDAEGNPIVLDYAKNFYDQLIKSSGKMVLLNKLLPKLYANGHKVLIFSQMVRVLDLLEELIKMMKYKYERLDGSTSSSSRAAAVDRFVRKSCQRFVMLLSTRAGGLGLNLTAADIVIIFDSDWNPQNDLQAMARAHRIGQTRSVRVYRILTAKTYEMHMFHSASMKLGLEKAVLSHQRDQGEGGGDGKSKSKSEREAQAKEIDSLLKKGAYDVFKEDADDEEAKKFMETDIDQLLERNSSTVTYGSTQNKMSSGLGSFSKASFVTDTVDGEKDVDLDDPDFWQKAVGLDAPVETPEEVKQMLDDGVKRSRKQVQQFDPYAEFAEIEKRKEEKIAQLLREEKEEKERVRAEKKKKKLEEKERKEKEREELRASKLAKSKSKVPPPDAPTAKAKPVAEESKEEEEEKLKVKKQPKEIKAKKPKPRNAEKQRALRRARNEDPGFERLKQAWDVPQRNRALAACLRYGFMRFCKIRNESNLTSLPIQDLEVFFRAYFFQLSLQVVVSFLQVLQKQDETDDSDLKNLLIESLGPTCRKEVDWLCNCFSNGMRHYREVEAQRVDLRMPVTLAEATFMDELRKGKALRALRRIFMMCRIQRIVEDCLDEILSELGHEELGKRGCQTSTISALDSDLKSRLITTEELSLGINAIMSKIPHRPPVAWWDHSCDIFLLIGTFVHGLGNYEAMLHDDSLPFAYKIKRFARTDVASVAAQAKFTKSTEAARKVFDDALEATKIKAQLEVSAAVAKASADAAKREKNALAMREGGASADAVLSTIVEEDPGDNKVFFKDDDPRFVTLLTLKAAVSSAAAGTADELSVRKNSVDGVPALVGGTEGGGKAEGSVGRRKGSVTTSLSMPDARILDQRLCILLSQVERNAYPDEAPEVELHTVLSSENSLWPTSKIVAINTEMRYRALLRVLALPKDEVEETIGEFAGIGTNGSQCAAVHRSLDDGSDFSMGTASADLAQVAYGPDAPRYLRAIGVPMSLTRYALAALVHADNAMVDRLLDCERARFAVKNKPASDVVAMEVEEAKVEKNEEKTEPSKEEGADGAKPTSNEEGKPEASKEASNAEVKTEAVESIKAEDENGATSVSNPAAEIVGTPTVPKLFNENHNLRASICVVVLHYGFPSEFAGHSKVDRSLWNSVRMQCGYIDELEPLSLFNATRFMALLEEFSGQSDLPDFAAINDYVMQCLLPHCLRLCVEGNGPTTVAARGSKVCKYEYETARGTSLYPEHAQDLQSPLPDPCLPMGEHSVEALASSSAILRRVRMMRAAIGVASGKLSLDKLNEILHSSFLRKSMEGLPVWWCPWIHDAALLIHASSRGFFSVLEDRTSSQNAPIALSPEKIKSQMYSTFMADDNVIHRAILDQCAPDDNQAWIDEHANIFPTPNVLERRLSFLCSKASEALGKESQYCNLPMFDHGSWPRN